MSWQETATETFVARHDERDAADALQVLRQLESARERLERPFGTHLESLDVVLHGSGWQLHAAQPWLGVQRSLTAPAGRRYLVGWAGETALHVLAPRLLAQRASNVEGSLEMLMLAPSALFARRLVAESVPELPPPFGPRAFRRYLRWAWLVEGAAQYLSGQTRHVRPAITRRLREGGKPAFPPSRRDAPLLGGTVFDLLAAEEGDAACVELARSPLSEGPEKALENAFHGRALRHTEDAWRAHLERLSGAGGDKIAVTRAPRRRRR